MIRPEHILLAFVVDLTIGDPRWIPHPVVLIGNLVNRLEKALRRKGDSTGVEYIKGGLLVLITLSVTLFSVFLFLWAVSLLGRSSVIISGALLVYLVSTTIATRGLITSARSVVRALEGEDIKRARGDLAMIVGRDTGRLDRKGILKATIETLSENLSDGVIAPLFYLTAGGIPLAMLYKAVNTMDSIVGYRNERYRYFGMIAARLDDVANFIPARLTGLLIAISVFLFVSMRNIREAARLSVRSIRTMFRDGRRHSSPNSGVPEAAMAGALGVRLGGPLRYSGVIVEKPYLGVETGRSYMQACYDALKVVFVASSLGVILSASVLYVM
ncbi:cobalamin biosynthesis protein [bacterium BMS3Bbin06]|nr:cobalamin biosynthesis protein [bacterium BMS3Abin08]GBE33511.1 cobalamin biosynthesis protein [bacterium BMS3Bbin06]HDO35525.1 cobalamin biosynthesis protein CobD [Nitrospirota bacterium]